jgi:hypothetical protein
VHSDDIHLTWAQRRELDLELWLMDHLAALADIRPGELDDAASLRALQTRAADLAKVIERLRLLRGDAAHVEREVAEGRRFLERL